MHPLVAAMGNQYHSGVLIGCVRVSLHSRGSAWAASYADIGTIENGRSRGPARRAVAEGSRARRAVQAYLTRKAGRAASMYRDSEKAKARPHSRNFPWPGARHISVGCGPTCAMTGRLPVPTRRQRSSSTRATVAVITLNGIWRAMPARCRRTPMPGSNGSTRQGAREARSSRRRDGRMGDASSMWRGSSGYEGGDPAP
jgi:hypothetical protein